MRGCERPASICMKRGFHRERNGCAPRAAMVKPPFQIVELKHRSDTDMLKASATALASLCTRSRTDYPDLEYLPMYLSALTHYQARLDVDCFCIQKCLQCPSHIFNLARSVPTLRRWHDALCAPQRPRHGLLQHQDRKQTRFWRPVQRHTELQLQAASLP